MIWWWILILVPVALSIHLGSLAMEIHRDLDTTPQRFDRLRDNFELKFPWRLFSSGTYTAEQERRRRRGRVYLVLSYLCLGLVLAVIMAAPR
jgi:hypothetical protein